MTLLVITALRPTPQAVIAANVAIRPIRAVGGRVGWVVRAMMLFGMLARLHSQDPISIISTQTIDSDAWICLLFGRLLRIPVVGQIHYDVFSSHARGTGPSSALKHRLALRIPPRFSAVRVVGKGIADEVRRRSLNANVQVIPVGTRMAPQNIAGAPSARAPVVLFVDRLVPQKNLADWLRVASLVHARCPDAKFEIVGDGPLGATLRDTCEELSWTKS